MDTHSKISVAAWVQSTFALGPGNRFALWLQGCPFNCPGCVAPSFLPIIPIYQLTPEQLFALIFQSKGCEGVTISGGEPMLQAEQLFPLIKFIRSKTPLSIIIYTGYYLSELDIISKNRLAVRKILDNIDVLIDGRYEHNHNDSNGLRGSNNQNVHFLTDRYKHLRNFFEKSQRKQEIHHLFDGDKMMVGIPTLTQWQQVTFDMTGQKNYDNIINTVRSNS